MALRRLAAAIRSSRANVRAELAPLIERYVLPLDYPELFKFATDSTDTDDGWTTLDPSTGLGRYKRVAKPDKGANLAGTTPQTLLVSGGPWRVLPATTLSANLVLTLGTTGAQEGDRFELTRLDVGAYTVTVNNGGAGAGTLCVMPVSSRARLVAYFDGTNWIHRCSHLML